MPQTLKKSSVGDSSTNFPTFEEILESYRQDKMLLWEAKHFVREGEAESVEAYNQRRARALHRAFEYTAQERAGAKAA
jgi:hypothetical protein